MRVTIRDAASLLGTTEENIYDWIESENLPAHKINDQYRINRSELLEWATTRKIPVAPALFQETDEPAHIPTISSSLRAGGIFYNISGNTREELLRNVVSLLPLADDTERETLVQMFVARESLGSTGVGDGIAIPHVRSPIVLDSDEPLLSLCFIKPSPDFNTADGKAVFALFVLVCPTIHIHLQMLARLAYLLRLPEFRETIRAQSSAEEIIATAARLESGK